MEKRRKTGCVVAASLGVLLVLGIVVTVVIGGYRVLSREWNDASKLESLAESRAEHERRHADGQVLRVDPAELSNPGPLKDGEALTLERFVAAQSDKGATELARQETLASFEGAPVNWPLEVVEVSERNGTLHARLHFEWQVRIQEYEDAWRSGVGLVHAFFPEDQRSDLLRLRRGDRVQVAGILRTDPTLPPPADAHPVRDRVAEADDLFQADEFLIIDEARLTAEE